MDPRLYGRSPVKPCALRLAQLVDDSILHLRAHGWPAAAVAYATFVPELRRFGLARADEVADAIRRRRQRDDLRRGVGLDTYPDPVPDGMWAGLLDGLDDRTAQALVTISDASVRGDTVVLAWFATLRLPVPRESRMARLKRRWARTTTPQEHP